MEHLLDFTFFGGSLAGGAFSWKHFRRNSRSMLSSMLLALAITIAPFLIWVILGFVLFFGYHYFIPNPQQQWFVNSITNILPLIILAVVWILTYLRFQKSNPTNSITNTQGNASALWERVSATAQRASSTIVSSLARLAPSTAKNNDDARSDLSMPNMAPRLPRGSLFILILVLAAFYFFSNSNPYPHQATNVSSGTPTNDVAYNQKCDDLAAHPADPHKWAAGVADEQVATGAAIEYCSHAVATSPDQMRYRFQLGRSLWIAGRHELALAEFAVAGENGYGPALKYIGDAYLTGTGLPPGQEASVTEALNWYKQSADLGFNDAAHALEMTEASIRQQTFDPTGFQDDTMQALYEGNIESLLKSKHSSIYYAQEVMTQLSSNEINILDVDHGDPRDRQYTCGSLVSKWTETGAGIVNFVSILKTIGSYGGDNPDSDSATDMLLSTITQGYIADRARKDTVTLVRRYSCNSIITKTVVDNISTFLTSAVAN